jgi:hypothetical protein
MTRHYTVDDLDIRTTERQTQDDQILAHTHTVMFSRALTAPEQQRFARLLCSLYDVVYFSGRFGESWLAEPLVTFPLPNQARYTLYQKGISGPWKDVLFAMLATFSQKVVGIKLHDHSCAFDPERQGEPKAEGEPETRQP